ncbi:MAG: NADH:flavin oxidoreductase, partial [Desulfobacteraceae bacterium]
MGTHVLTDNTEALFRSIDFGSVTARNRVVMAPMLTNFGGPEDGVREHQMKYYAERARGGVGTLIVEASSVRQDARISPRQLGIYHDRFIPGLARLAGAIKREGALAFLQLCHGGPKTFSSAGIKPESISRVGIGYGDEPRMLTRAELRKIRGEFVAASVRARAAGFDGVELHAAHFYLLSASISPFTNQRRDAYGGSIANRARLTREIVEDVKAELGHDYPVWVRINACETLDPGLTLEEGQQVANILAEAGADGIHVSAYTVPMNEAIRKRMKIQVGSIPLQDTPPGPFLPYAAAIRRAVHVPVIGVAKLDDPMIASEALVKGKCDLIALGRQLLCDPYWPGKVQDGRTHEIVHCKYCMTCHTALLKSKEVRCAQNLNLFGKPHYKEPSKE